MSFSIVIDALAKRGAISEAIEAEHEFISALIGALNTAIASGVDQPVIIHMLDIVVEECRNHFVAEEKYLADGGAATLAAHAGVHNRLLDRALQVRAEIARRDPLGIPNAVDLLCALRNHITSYDQPALASLQPFESAA